MSGHPFSISFYFGNLKYFSSQNIIAAAASAVAALGKESRLRVFILYPRHQCSDIQHDQMAVLMAKHPDRIRIYATDKNMDEQRVVVKKMMSDTNFVDKYNLCGMHCIGRYHNHLTIHTLHRNELDKFRAYIGSDLLLYLVLFTNPSKV